MHKYTGEVDEVVDRVVDFVRWRLAAENMPLGSIMTEAELTLATGPMITAEGLGGRAVLELFTTILAPATLAVDFKRNLSFVPAAPTELSVLFDLVVGACSIRGDSWVESSGAVHAENSALKWLCTLAGFPSSAGGVFVPGGTIGNLSAMVAAREHARANVPSAQRWLFIASSTSHSSVQEAADIMDADVLTLPVDNDFRLEGEEVRRALEVHGDRVAAVVATAGSTNLGRIDELAGIADACSDHGVWLHVDGAYGGAGLASPRTRALYEGIQLADSFVVDPHKWLFAPFDCCALIFREPDYARTVHAQEAPYLDFLNSRGDWNPSDFAIHLTRRARGLPFWFSLASYGSDAYADAIDQTIDLAQGAAQMIRELDHVELVVEPSLSVVVFQRPGWHSADYEQQTEEMIAAGRGFVVPSRHQGEPCYRLCFVNPNTSLEDVREILDAMG